MSADGPDREAEAEVLKKEAEAMMEAEAFMEAEAVVEAEAVIEGEAVEP